MAYSLTLTFSFSKRRVGLLFEELGINGGINVISGLIAELLRALGARAEPHTLANLLTHPSQKFWLSRDCPYVPLSVRTYVRTPHYIKFRTLNLLWTRDLATRVSGRKWVQSTELDIVNGSFCNLCKLALWLALHIFATQCWRAPRRAKQLSIVAILLYRFLSCWCLETFFTKYQPCTLSFVFSS